MKTHFETMSFIIREEHTLRIPEKTVLRRILGPKREEQKVGEHMHTSL
jgi:hypothetical protein